MKRTIVGAVAVLVMVGGAWIAMSTGVVHAGGACRGEPVTAERTTTVDMGDMPCFTPTVVEIEVGDTVTWTNSGSMVHNVFGANSSWAAVPEVSLSAEIPVGGSAEHTFADTGLFPYACMLHPGMIGTVVVAADGAGVESTSLSGSSGDAARFAVADEGGESDILWAVAAGAVAVTVAAGVGGYALGRLRR